MIPNNSIELNFVKETQEIDLQSIYSDAESTYTIYIVWLLVTIGINIVSYNLFKYKKMSIDTYNKIRYYTDVAQACVFFILVGFFIWVRL
jgi:hypothetical protein